MVEQIAQQKQIFDFSEIERKPTMVKSATSNTKYLVDIRPGHESCQCEFFKRRKGICRHILQRKLIVAGEKLNYFMDRNKFSSKAFFDSVEQVTMHFESNDDPEYNHLTALFLATAFIHGGVTSDDIYFQVRGEFTHDSRILGAIASSLVKKGLLEPTGEEIKTERKGNHGNKLKVFRLTEKAKFFIENLPKFA